MLKKSILAFLAVIIFLGASVSFALITFSKDGIWPDAWPKELEKFRTQARSYTRDLGIEEQWHEIIFQNREEFEQAWPHILKLKTQGSPLIIKNTQASPGHRGSGPGSILQVGIPGVRILCTVPDGPSARRLSSELPLTWPTPWPDYIKLSSGGLPEFVVYQDGKWIAADMEQFTGEYGHEGIGNYCRARVDIVLISDGKIVDLNRIPLPEDTPIIDERFEGSD